MNNCTKPNRRKAVSETLEVSSAAIIIATREQVRLIGFIGFEEMWTNLAAIRTQLPI